MPLAILSTAIVVEAIVLVGLITLVARLYARLGQVTALSSAPAEQMAALLAEARALSASIAATLEEQVSVQESLEAALAQARTQASGTPPPTVAPLVAEQRPARRSATATGRTKAAAPAPRLVPQAEEDEESLATARDHGMDPVGLALQRQLRKRRTAAENT